MNYEKVNNTITRYDSHLYQAAFKIRLKCTCIRPYMCVQCMLRCTQDSSSIMYTYVESTQRSHGLSFIINEIVRSISRYENLILKLHVIVTYESFQNYTNFYMI